MRNLITQYLNDICTKQAIVSFTPSHFASFQCGKTTAIFTYSECKRANYRIYVMLHYTTYLRYFCRSADCLPWPLIGLTKGDKILRVTNLTRPGGSSWQLLLDTNLSYERISCMLFSKSQQKNSQVYMFMPCFAEFFGVLPTDVWDKQVIYPPYPN